jgi:hypothetical protein
MGGGVHGTDCGSPHVTADCLGDSVESTSSTLLHGLDISCPHECSPEMLRFTAPVNSKISDVIRIMSGRARYRFRSISLLVDRFPGMNCALISSSPTRLCNWMLFRVRDREWWH